jgi:hypothetical protein
MCVALLALFVTLGGSTYAITALPRDSVGSAQLRDRSVTEDHLVNRSVISRKLANGAVTNRKIARGAITGSRLAPDSLGGAQINEGLLAPVPLAAQAERAKLATRAETVDHVERAARADHAENAANAERAAEADALAVVDRQFDIANVPEDGVGEFRITCGEGEAVTGGGWRQIGDQGDFVVLSYSGPSPPQGWEVVVFDIGPTTGMDTPGFVYAICVKAIQTSG